MRVYLLIGLALASLAWLFWPTDSAAERLLADYGNRLARTLEQPIELTPFQPQALLLPLDQRRLPEPVARTSLGKALSLGECGLVQDLARVNNSLGKVAPASERLLITQRLLQTAAACQPDDPTLQQSLAQLIEHRQALWPVLMHNAIVAGPEFSAYFSAGTAPLAPGAPIDNSLAALLSWSERQQQDIPDEGGQLNPLLQRLNQSAQGGAALQAQALVETQLPQLTKAIEASPICQGPRKVEQRRLAEQVFASQYLERVQPWLAVISKALRPVYEIPASHPWKTGQSTWGSWQETTKQHALAWRSLLERCGLSPPSAGNS